METHDTEKTALISKDTIGIRPVTLDDAPSIAALDRHVIQFSLGATRDTPSSLDDTVRYIKALKAATPPSLIYLVAEHQGAPLSFNGTSLPHELGEKKRQHSKFLGYVVLAPYSGGRGAPRSCFAKTASMYVTVWEDDVIGPELGNSVRKALASEAAIVAREKHYRSIVFDTMAGRDQSELQRVVGAYHDVGFEQVGLLKGIMEKHGQLLDRVFLQKIL